MSQARHLYSLMVHVQGHSQGGLCYVGELLCALQHSLIRFLSWSRQKEFVYMPHCFVSSSCAYIVDGGVNAHEKRSWMHVSTTCSGHSGQSGGRVEMEN